MITILLSAAGIFGGILLLGCIVGMMLDDIAAIRRDTRIRRHPHAKAYRQRPFVTVMIRADNNETNLARCLASIKANRYRNKHIVVVQPEQPVAPHGHQRLGMTLTIRSADSLASDAIISAVRQLADNPSQMSIELSPAIASPSSLPQLLRNYQLLFESLFVKSRNAFKIVESSRLVMQRPHKPLKRQRIYTGIAIIAKLILPIALLYITYVAIRLHQPHLLLGIIAGFTLLLTTLVWSTSMLATKEKIIYTVLLPVSLGYFYARACAALVKTCAQIATTNRSSKNAYEYASS